MDEDRQGAKQGEDARGIGRAHHASVFILGSIPAMMLSILDTPMSANQLQESVRADFFRQQTGHKINDFLGMLDDFALADGIDDAPDAYQLRCASQSQGLRVDIATPQISNFNPTVPFADRLSLRGEKSPTKVVEPWRKHAVGCL